MITLTKQLRIGNKTIEVEICNTFFQRLIGFMFQKKKIQTGKCFPHCNSIHTFFMFQKIDLILCDHELKIISIYKNFSKNRILWPVRNAWYVFELPLGSIQNTQIEDQLKLEDF